MYISFATAIQRQSARRPYRFSVTISYDPPMSEPDSDTPALRSVVDRAAEDYRANEAYHRGLLADLEGRLERARRGGPAKSVELHRSRGKLTARERIDRLIDHGSFFLELSPLAAMGIYDDEVPSAGIVT